MCATVFPHDVQTFSLPSALNSALPLLRYLIVARILLKIRALAQLPHAPVGGPNATTGCMIRSLTKTTLLLFLLASLAIAVHADTVNLKLVNTAPNNNAGGVYVYPYNFSINGSPALTALLCDDFSHEVILGESWNANVNTLAAAAAGAGQFSAASYTKAGWLFEQLVNNAPYASPVAINWAIWKTTSPSLVVPSDVLGIASTPGSVAWWLDHVPASVDPNTLTNLVVYTWDGNTQTLKNGPGGPPQEYLGTRSVPSDVPEPASMILMLSGGGAVLLRRRKSSAQLES